MGRGKRVVISQGRAKGVRANDKICICFDPVYSDEQKNAPIIYHVSFISKLPPEELVKVLVLYPSKQINASLFVSLMSDTAML